MKNSDGGQLAILHSLGTDLLRNILAKGLQFSTI